MATSRRTYAVTLFLILIVFYGYFMPRWADWGANSRANLTYAFGDQGVLNIDAYHTNTGDKACFPGPYTRNPDAVNEGTCEGNYYSDKSLGPSLLALPFYMVFKGIAALPPVQQIIESGAGMGAMGDTLNPDGRGANPAAVYQFLALTFITFFASAVPSALLSVVVFLMACRFARRDWYAFVLALAYGLGTMALPYSNALYQHQLAAFGAFIGFYYLWRVIKEGASLNWLWLVGVLFSFATITEYPIVPLLGIIFVWALIQMPNRLALYRVVIGAIPLGIIFMAYNYAAFQSVLPVGYQYSTNWQGEHQTGFLSLTAPDEENFVRLYGLTFSPVRGIFLMSPFLLLAIPGFVLMWQQQKALRGVLGVMLLAVVFFLFYNSSSVMWWGGFTVGPRYLVPMLPFMVLPIIFVLNSLLERLWGKALVAVLVVVSIFSVGAMTIAGQQWPPVDTWPTSFDLMNQTSTLFDYSLPLLAAGDVARNYGLVIGLRGLASLLPLLAALVVIGVGVPLVMRRRDARPAPVASVKPMPGQS